MAGLLGLLIPISYFHNDLCFFQWFFVCCTYSTSVIKCQIITSYQKTLIYSVTVTANVHIVGYQPITDLLCLQQLSTLLLW